MDQPERVRFSPPSVSGTALAAGVFLCLMQRSPVAGAIPLSKSTPLGYRPLADELTEQTDDYALKGIPQLIFARSTRVSGVGLVESEPNDSSERAKTS